MIARELTEFFATFARRCRAAHLRAGRPDVPVERQRRLPPRLLGGDPVRGRRLQRGPGVRPRARCAPRWRKAYHPGAGVLHAHDYAPLEFMRRYFDEYRGLRETIGHIEPFGVRSTAARRARAGRRRPALHARARIGAAERARWTARAAVHHGGRKAFSALGSRAHALPAGVQRALSLEGRAANGQPPSVAAPPAPPLPPLVHAPAQRGAVSYAGIARALKSGPAPLLPPYPGDGRAAAAAPRVRRSRPSTSGPAATTSSSSSSSGSSGWATSCSLWIHDAFGPRPHDGAGRPAARDRRWFAPVKAPVFRGFDQWHGADVVVATGWQTVYPVLELDGVRARAYLINDHEPEFFATSVESEWAERTYRLGPLRHRREPLAARSVRRALRRPGGRLPVRRRPGRLLPAADRAPPRHRRRLRPRRHAAARGRAGDAGPRGAAAPPAGRADRPVRQTAAAVHAVRLRARRRRSHERSPGCSRRRPPASACR